MVRALLLKHRFHRHRHRNLDADNFIQSKKIDQVSEQNPQMAASDTQAILKM